MAALYSLVTQPIFMFGIGPIHMHLALLKHIAHLGLPLEPVKIPVDGIPFLQHADCTTLFGVIHKLPDGILNPTFHVANKNAK